MTHEDVAPLAGMDPELGLLAATLIDSTREWRENLEQPSPEAIIWQPYPGGPSIGGVILHMVNCETYWLSEVALKLESDPSDPAGIYDRLVNQYVPTWPIPPNQPIEWYFNLQDRHRVKALENIAAHNRPLQFYERRDYSTTYRWILAHVIQHDSYTGGQAVLLHEMWKKLAA